MEVILLERLGRLGNTGDVVAVRDGYARNFLIPQSKALRATDANKKIFESRRAEIEAKNAEAKAVATAQAKTLEGLDLRLQRQASQEGKLYGAVTVRDIAELLKEAGHTIPKSQIILSGSIKNTGEYPVRIDLHAEVPVTLTLFVDRIEVAA